MLQSLNHYVDASKFDHLSRKDFLFFAMFVAAFTIPAIDFVRQHLSSYPGATPANVLHVAETGTHGLKYQKCDAQVHMPSRTSVNEVVLDFRLIQKPGLRGRSLVLHLMLQFCTQSDGGAISPDESGIALIDCFLGRHGRVADMFGHSGSGAVLL